MADVAEKEVAAASETIEFEVTLKHEISKLEAFLENFLILKIFWKRNLKKVDREWGCAINVKL